MILEIENLSVEFLKSGPGREAFRAVDRLSLSVPEGSFTALVGESGSGKTVTALSICRLMRPHRLSGAIRFAYEGGAPLELLSCPEEALLKVRGARIGYVFQDPASSFNPLMKVGEQLDETRLAHFGGSSADARRRSLALLERVRIQDPERVYRSFPHELSGGMKQRAMIAMALIAEPRLLVADEPTTALDAATEHEVMELLVNLRKEASLTILFITHNLPLAAERADCIYVMQRGRLVEKMKKQARGFEPVDIYSRRLFNAGSYGSSPKSFIEIA